MPGTIYDVDDYRAFLGQWLDAKKSRSIRGLATKLGCSSSYVAMVRKGSRNLNLEHARHWAWGLQLDTYEAEVWEAMVRREHGPTEEMRARAGRQIEAARAWQEALGKQRGLQVFANWYSQVVFELAQIPGFRLDPEWVAARIRPAITASGSPTRPVL